MGTKESSDRGSANNRIKVGLGQSSGLVTTRTGLSCRSGAACPWQGGCSPMEMSHGIGKGTWSCLGAAGCSRGNLEAFRSVIFYDYVIF